MLKSLVSRIKNFALIKRLLRRAYASCRAGTPLYRRPKKMQFQ